MERKTIFKIGGGVISLVGGIVSVKAMLKPSNLPLGIFGIVLVFLGRLLGEYGDDWFD